MNERRARQLPATVVRSLCGFAAAALLAGCASLSTPGPFETVDPPRYVAPTGIAPPRVALVLSGGAARGFAHIGVLRVLEREGLKPDLVVGASAGAIVGALYASGMPVAEMEAVAARLGWGTLLDIDPVRALLEGAMPLGLARGERLEAFLREPLRAPMQSFPIRFAAVTTDLSSGETVLLNHGDAARALRASSAVPGLYQPVEVDGRRLVDGQVVAPLPVAAARRLGARCVVAVDVVYPPEQSSLSNPISVLFQTMLVSTWRHLLEARKQADVVVTPEIAPTTSQYGLSDREWLIKAGEAAAEKALPRLRAAMQPPRTGSSAPYRATDHSLRRARQPGHNLLAVDPRQLKSDRLAGGEQLEHLLVLRLERHRHRRHVHRRHRAVRDRHRARRGVDRFDRSAGLVRPRMLHAAVRAHHGHAVLHVHAAIAMGHRRHRDR